VRIARSATAIRERIERELLTETRTQAARVRGQDALADGILWAIVGSDRRASPATNAAPPNLGCYRAIIA